MVTCHEETDFTLATTLGKLVSTAHQVMDLMNCTETRTLSHILHGLVPFVPPVMVENKSMTSVRRLPVSTSVRTIARNAPLPQGIHGPACWPTVGG